MTSKSGNKGAGALMQYALKLYQSGEAALKEGVGIEPKDAFHSANAVLVRAIEKFADFVQFSWHEDLNKRGWDNERAIVIVSYGQQIHIPLPLSVLEEQGLTKKVRNEMSQIYVVYSGRPAGEIYDREVHLLMAESSEEAISVCNIDTTDCCNEWLWGPHAKEQETLEEAIAFAVYRASDGRGQLYSHIKAHGFENNQQVVDMAYAKADEDEKRQYED